MSSEQDDPNFDEGEEEQSLTESDEIDEDFEDEEEDFD